MASPSRSSLEKLEIRLKELSKRVPEWDDTWELIFGHAPTSAALDRAAALSAAAFVDHALQKAITTHLRKDISETELKKLFTASMAPLGSLYTKTLLAQALGIIHAENAQQLETIRNIRNAFAHSMTHIEFNDAPIKELCFSLSIAQSFSSLDQPDAAKRVYVSAVATIFFNLIDYYDGIDAEIFREATS